MPPPPQQQIFDPYKELELDRSATLAEITSSYKRLARVHHPDRNHGNEETATEAFQRLGKAYEMLSDPRQRDEYDNPSARSRRSAPQYYDDDVDEDDDWDEDDEYYYEYDIPRYGPFSGGGFGGFPFFFAGPGFASGSRSPPRPSFDEWERMMKEREAYARAKEAEYAERRKLAREEREARDEAARIKQEQKRAAKQAVANAALAEKKKLFEEETRVQKQRWLEGGAVSRDERLAACLHSDHCMKIDLRKKVKCGACHAKRGNLAFECPHCSVHLCQLCVTNFSNRRQKLAKTARKASTTPSTQPTSGRASPSEAGEAAESPATSFEDFSGDDGKAEADNAAQAGSKDAGKSKSTASIKRKQQDRCTFAPCKRKGHTEDKCWKKHPELRRTQLPTREATASFPSAGPNQKPTTGGQQRQAPTPHSNPHKTNKVPKDGVKNAPTKAKLPRCPGARPSEGASEGIDNITSGMANTKLDDTNTGKPAQAQPQNQTPANKPKKQRGKGNKNKAAATNAFVGSNLA